MRTPVAWCNIKMEMRSMHKCADARARDCVCVWVCRVKIYKNVFSNYLQNSHPRKKVHIPVCIHTQTHSGEVSARARPTEHAHLSRLQHFISKTIPKLPYLQKVSPLYTSVVHSIMIMIMIIIYIQFRT